MRIFIFLKKFSVVAVIGIALVGCTSSHTSATKLGVQSHHQSALEVMPFAVARKQFATGSQSLLGLATGLDTYKFDQSDYGNLRASLIKSLKQSNSFTDVRDIQDSSQAGNDLRLFLEFERSGMNRTTLGFSCVLNGAARIENATGTVLATKTISVKEESLLTVGDAKNKSIKKFILKWVAF